MNLNIANRISKLTNSRNYVFALVLGLLLLTANVWGQQVTGSISGQVRDSSGAAIVGANVTARNTETGLSRSIMSNDNGNFLIVPLPAGTYEVTAEKTGFKKSVQTGLNVVAAGQAVANATLEVGNVEQSVTVEATNLVVNTTLAPTADLVTQEQVKDLPLNGRDWGGLLTLNPGVINSSATQNTFNGSTTGAPTFSVAGRRYEENRFLMNGIDYVGSDMQGENPQPFGSSGKLLGVDGIREFNLVTDTYGAELGKRAGGQILILTNPGTNTVHGDAFEFLRNNHLDARDFFDPAFSSTTGLPVNAPDFKQNQFGGSLGGPLKKDKLFLFGTYEGFRERQARTSGPEVPDSIVRNTLMIPDFCTGVYSKVTGTKPGMLPIVQSYWVAPNNSSVEHTHTVTAQFITPLGPCAPSTLNNVVPDGVVSVPGNSPAIVNENFGMERFDWIISAKDSFNSNYLMDDGNGNLPSRNPVSSVIIPQRSQLITLQETHIFSANLINVLSGGFSRGWQAQSNVPINTFPAAANFAKGGALGAGYPGKITVGASTSVNSGTNLVTGTINALNTLQHRNFTTGSDDVHYIHGNHSVTFGVWAQRVGNNYNGGSPTASTAYGPGATGTSLLINLVTDVPKKFSDNPNPTALGGRITQAAFYVQDEIKLRSNLSFRIGVREEMTSGFNEQNCRFSVYSTVGGIPQTTPVGSCSALLQNKAIALWEPRAGIAWDPTGKGTWSIRAGAGMYRDLQDSLIGLETGLFPFSSTFVRPSSGKVVVGGILGCSADPAASNFCPGTTLATQINPLIPFDITANSVTVAPPCVATGVPAGCTIYGMGGVDPYMQTPTVTEWSFTVEHQLSKDMGIRLSYVGSQSYHGAILIPNNVIPSQVCVLGGCPTANAGQGINDPTKPNPTAAAGQIYIPGAQAPAPPVSVLNPFLAAGSGQTMYEANSDYHGGSISFAKKSAHGLSINASYTMSKVMEASAESNGGANDPGTLDAYRLNLSRGIAAFNVLHAFTSNFGYELPFGMGKRFGGSATGLKNQIIGGWQWNGIISAQSGFPFTPIAGTSGQNNGDGAGSDVASRNPLFTGSVYLDPRANSNHAVFDSNAFSAPPLGTYGNIARGSYTGPGLISVDTSIFKTFKMTERFNLMFRTEIFNVINHENFGIPNETITSGQITQSATRPRQIQFALKLSF